MLLFSVEGKQGDSESSKKVLNFQITERLTQKASPFVFFFLLFPSPPCFSNGLAKVFLTIFHSSLPKKLVTRIGLINAGFKLQRLEPCPSTTKNMTYSPVQCLWPPNLAWWWHPLRALTHKVTWRFDHMVLQDHATN